MRDVIGSFLMFFIVIGPAVYYSYKGSPEQKQEGKMKEDKVTQILKKIKNEGKDVVDESGEYKGEKITFEDYEKVMMALIEK